MVKAASPLFVGRRVWQLGNVSQSTMSNHLSVLQQAGLIKVEKYGQWSYFSRNEALIQQYLDHLKQAL